MKQEFEMKILADGTIETIYQDGIEEFADEIGADVAKVCRVSEVEWEEIEKPINARFPQTKGWTVRAVSDRELALRISSGPLMGNGYIDVIQCSRNPYQAIALFDSREDAITQEIKHFWELKHG